MCNTPKIPHIYYICTAYVKTGGTFHSVVGMIMNGIMLTDILFCRGGYGLKEWNMFQIFSCHLIKSICF